MDDNYKKCQLCGKGFFHIDPNSSRKVRPPKPKGYVVNDQGVERWFCGEKHADKFLIEKYQMSLPFAVDPCSNTGLPYTSEVAG